MPPEPTTRDYWRLATPAIIALGALLRGAHLFALSRSALDIVYNSGSLRKDLIVAVNTKKDSDLEPAMLHIIKSGGKVAGAYALLIG